MSKKKAKPEGKPGKVQLIRKISPKHVCGKIEVPDEETTLFTVYGIATRVRPFKSTYGEGYALVGNFEAVRASDGVLFRAPQVFLPEPMHSMAVEQLKDGKIESVRFGIEVGIRPADNSVGYEYVADNKMDVQANDQLIDLRKAIGFDG